MDAYAYGGRLDAATSTNGKDEHAEDVAEGFAESEDNIEEQEQQRMLEKSVMEDCERDIGMVFLGESEIPCRMPLPESRKASPVPDGHASDDDQEEVRFTRWYFEKLLYAQTGIFVIILGVYFMCLPEDAGTLQINGTVIFSLDYGVYTLFGVAIVALLAVSQLPERWRRKAITASLVPFPFTCLMYVLVYSHAPVEVTRKRLMHIQWGGWEQPLHMMPAFLAAGFIGMGFKSTLTAMALLRPGQAIIIPLIYASCLVLTFGHCYYLTGERSALDLMALTTVAFGLGCYVGWRAESLTRRLWISNERAEERLQKELKVKEMETFADLVDLRYQNTLLLEEKERAVVMIEAQARRRRVAESLLRKAQRDTNNRSVTQ